MSFETVVNFSFKLIPLINGSEKSVIFSPTSIFNGLSMVLAGAKGSTAQQLLNLLGNDKSVKDIIQYYSNQMKSYKIVKNITEEDDDEVKVIYGNRLFVSESVTLIPEYVEIINQSFDGHLQRTNFQDNIKAAEDINKFINEITKSKIPKITESNQINQQVLLIIVNAVYFSGKWENIFEKRFKLPFYGFSNTVRELDVACQRIYDEKWNFVEGPDWECLGIPYKNYKAWMFIVLPKEKDGLKELINKLDYNSSESGYMRIVIPIFEITDSFVMNNLLKKFGVTDAFGGTCDLSGMMTSKAQIDEVLHKATIKVDEYGTEASAATVCKIVPRNAPRYFTADHPFLYFIATTKNETINELSEILFVGTFF